MAISDIWNAAYQFRNQQQQFDQDAWKTAFDIANGFTKLENNRTVADENARKHQEMLDTQAWRTAFMNNNYSTGIEKDKLDVANLTRVFNNALQTDPGEIAAINAENADKLNLANWNIQTRDQTKPNEIRNTNLGYQNTFEQDKLNKELAAFSANSTFKPDGTRYTTEEQIALAQKQFKDNPMALAQIYSQFTKPQEPTWQEKESYKTRTELTQSYLKELSALETTMQGMGETEKQKARNELANRYLQVTNSLGITPYALAQPQNTAPGSIQQTATMPTPTVRVEGQANAMSPSAPVQVAPDLMAIYNSTPFSLTNNAPQTLQTTQSIVMQPISTEKQTLQKDNNGLAPNYAANYNRMVATYEQMIKQGILTQEQADNLLKTQLVRLQAEQAEAIQDAKQALQNYKPPYWLSHSESYSPY